MLYLNPFYIVTFVFHCIITLDTNTPVWIKKCQTFSMIRSVIDVKNAHVVTLYCQLYYAVDVGKCQPYMAEFACRRYTLRHT